MFYIVTFVLFIYVYIYIGLYHICRLWCCIQHENTEIKTGKCQELGLPIYSIDNLACVATDRVDMNNVLFINIY